MADFFQNGVIVNLQKVLVNHTDPMGECIFWRKNGDWLVVEEDLP